MIPVVIHMPKHEDSIESLDKEIERVNISFAQLKEQRNDHLPLFHLPTELLTDILYYYLYDHLQEYECPVSAPLTTLLRVSRRIRTLTLNCRKLWSLVDFGFGRSAEKMLSMAGTTPLIIRVLQEYESDHLATQSQILYSVSENLQRLQELHICATDPGLRRLFAAMDKSQPTTIPLTSLRIACTTLGWPPLSKSLLSCSAPGLSEVVMSRVDFPLDSPLCGSALGHLELVGARQKGGSLRAIVDGLRNLTNLHTLILRNYLPISSLAEMESIKPFLPPRLRFLTLQDDIIGCARLLNFMEVHHLTRLDLSCEVEPMQEPIIYPFLTAFTGGEEGGWIRTLSLTQQIGQPRLSVSFGCSGRYPADDDEVGVLFSKMRLESLRSLITDGCDTWSDAAWRRAFQQCIHLTHLVGYGLNFDNLTKTLSTGVEGIGQIMMEKLQCLELSSLHDDENSIEKLKVMLWDRRLSLTPLQELRFLGYFGVRKRDWLFLEELVPKLHRGVDLARWNAYEPL